jgi:hypothetical protein
MSIPSFNRIPGRLNNSRFRYLASVDVRETSRPLVIDRFYFTPDPNPVVAPGVGLTNGDLSWSCVHKTDSGSPADRWTGGISNPCPNQNDRYWVDDPAYPAYLASIGRSPGPAGYVVKSYPILRGDPDAGTLATDESSEERVTIETRNLTDSAINVYRESFFGNCNSPTGPTVDRYSFVQPAYRREISGLAMSNALYTDTCVFADATPFCFRRRNPSIDAQYLMSVDLDIAYGPVWASATSVWVRHYNLSHPGPIPDLYEVVVMRGVRAV